MSHTTEATENEALPEAAVPLRPLAGRPGSDGFGRTFARHHRPPLRHLLPGRRAWITGLTVGALVAAGVAAPQLVQRYTDSSPTKPVAAQAKQPAPVPVSVEGAAPTGSTSAQPPQKAAAPAALEAVTTAWTGPGCPVPAGGGYREVNRDDTKGWHTVDSGGLQQQGCDGTFTSVPMSGDGAKDGPNRAVWWWTVGEGRTCELSLYVPDVADSNNVGGHPTTYLVLGDPDDEGSQYGSFTIDQTNLTGKTATAGPFDVKGSRLAVAMLDRGDDNWSDGTVPRHAASLVKAACRDK